MSEESRVVSLSDALPKPVSADELGIYGPMPKLGPLEVDPAIPRRFGATARLIGRRFQGMFGWSTEGRFPAEKKLLAVVAPHSSGWDFIYTVAAGLQMGIDARFLGKATLFDNPFAARFFRLLGGTPVRRDASTGAVSRAAAVFAEHEKLLLGLSPEGTRKPVANWRSGFYWIAHEAAVPIVLVAIDYARKVIAIGPSLATCGDLEIDMAAIQKWYSTVVPANPTSTWNGHASTVVEATG